MAGVGFCVCFCVSWRGSRGPADRRGSDLGLAVDLPSRTSPPITASVNLDDDGGVGGTLIDGHRTQRPGGEPASENSSSISIRTMFESLMRGDAEADTRSGAGPEPMPSPPPSRQAAEPAGGAGLPAGEPGQLTQVGAATDVGLRGCSGDGISAVMLSVARMCGVASTFERRYARAWSTIPRQGSDAGAEELARAFQTGPRTPKQGLEAGRHAQQGLLRVGAP